ncbi:nitroreductase family deazaflavin-dependent oxidoreductase [Halioglobus maricola]|uniref:Nitroreductase family deazaflavin-dependent oxidoreductase n=1 Tax=Halioglobus maricola TaxID=2601894 RepID=A0A5P9NKM3_9GAMM|nr:nitroreductase family deazaflavin-dependent oxidoreductase [Halioglobus maricola]QFU76282.1 nitroreductase family deazaflavin-dependent oxidoreductase [Halioglobus maricola]
MALLQTNLAAKALNQTKVVTLLKRVVPPLDRFLLKISRGWINTAMQSVMLLETTGAKSGQTRQLATLCMPFNGDLILVGSNWGQERHPAWVHNLRANPTARVRFRGYVGTVTATELEPEQRDRVWPQLVKFNPQYAQYQANTSRTLPVFTLSPNP